MPGKHRLHGAERRQIAKLREVSRKVKKQSKTLDDKIGHRGQPINSNLTDNDSAKIKTSHGVIQGYTAVSAVDYKHQVIVAAEAFGEAQEHRLSQPVIEQTRYALGKSYIEKAALTVDAGFHNTDNIQYCQDHRIDAYIADKALRRRDWCFKDYERYKTRAKPKKWFRHTDFHYDPKSGRTADLVQPARLCPGQPPLHPLRGLFEYLQAVFAATPLHEKPATSHGRTVVIRLGEAKSSASASRQMCQKLDTARGRYVYSRRIGTVEPVFGNVTINKRLRRFTLRGKSKVNGQWLMWCLVHNIEKLQRYAPFA